MENNPVTPPSASPTPPVNMPSVVVTPAATPSVTQVSQDTGGGGSKKTMLLIGALVLVILVLGVGAFMLRNNQSSEQVLTNQNDTKAAEASQALGDMDKELQTLETELPAVDGEFSAIDADLQTL